MIIGVTGYKGRLGSELVKHGCTPLDCDITSRMSIRQALHDVKPDIVIHCAAMTDVDKCEEYKDEAIEINAKGTENLKVCFDGQIVYISTDYIFSGKGKGMYHEYDKPADPKCLCWYGYTKLLGEQLLGMKDIIIRTTMLYGSPVKDDFVTHILQKLELGTPFEVTRALYGTPTYVPHLAEGILKLIDKPSTTLCLNIAGADLLNRYDFALIIASVMGYEDRKSLIRPTLKIGKTKRPRHAGLSTRYASSIGIPIYSVLDGLKDFGPSKANIFRQLGMKL